MWQRVVHSTIVSSRLVVSSPYCIGVVVGFGLWWLLGESSGESRVIYFHRIVLKCVWWIWWRSSMLDLLQSGDRCCCCCCWSVGVKLIPPYSQEEWSRLVLLLYGILLNWRCCCYCCIRMWWVVAGVEFCSFSSVLSLRWRFRYWINVNGNCADYIQYDYYEEMWSSCSNCLNKSMVVT